MTVVLAMSSTVLLGRLPEVSAISQACLTSLRRAVEMNFQCETVYGISWAIAGDVILEKPGF